MKMNANISDVAMKHVKVPSPALEKRSSPTSGRPSRHGSLSSNSASEVYYGDSSVSVPFRWESRPGTPKVNHGGRRPLPPLTPPPSYLSSPARKSSKKHHLEAAADICSSGGILHNVLPKLNLIRKSHSSSPSLSSSSSSSSSSVSSSPWSSSRSARSSPCTPDSESRPRRKLAHHFRRNEDEEDGEDEEAHLESLCFGIAGRSSSSKRGCSANFIKLLLGQHA